MRHKIGRHPSFLSRTVAKLKFAKVRDYNGYSLASLAGVMKYTSYRSKLRRYIDTMVKDPYVSYV